MQPSIPSPGFRRVDNATPRRWTGPHCAISIRPQSGPCWRRATGRRPRIGCCRHSVAYSRRHGNSGNGCRDVSPGVSPRQGRALAFGELRALFAACAADPSLRGWRDAAMLTVLCGGGLRRAEVVSLDLADYDNETGTLTVHGKGRKERAVYATNGTHEALAAWLTACGRSEEHTSELQSLRHLVCRLLLE